MKCNSLRGAALAVGLVSLSVCVEPSLAASTVFFGRDVSIASMPNSQAQFNQFTATLASFGMDDIEGINTGAPTYGFDPQLVFGATGITAGTQMTTTAVHPPLAGFSIGAQSLVESDAMAAFDPNAPQFPPADTTFTFNQHITAFGVFVIQAGDGPVNNNPITFRLIDTDSNLSVDEVLQPVGPDWGSNNVFFFGVTNTTPFNRVQLLETTDATDGMLFDNVVAGLAIPEPSSLVLLLFGGAYMLCRADRSRRG